MRLSEYVRTVEKAKHLSKRSGVAESGISNFLRGNRGFSAVSIAKIIKATGGLVTFNEIVSEIEELRRKRSSAEAFQSNPRSSRLLCQESEL